MNRRKKTNKELDAQRILEQRLINELKACSDYARQRLHSEIRDHNKKIFELLHPPRTIRRNYGTIYLLLQQVLFDGLQREIENKFDSIFVLANGKEIDFD